MIDVGDPAPDFEAVDCEGKSVRLSAFRGRRVVLFFFPKSFSIGCTLELRHFRDSEDKIDALGAELIGVSVDSVAQQCVFARDEKISFSLIGDESKEISQKYGVLWPLLKVDRRVTFIIDAEGIVESVIRHEVRVYKHLDDVLAHLESRKTKPLP